MPLFCLVFCGKCWYTLLMSQWGIHGSTSIIDYVITNIFQTFHWPNHFSGDNCGLWWSYTYSNQQILSSTEFKALSFALHLKSHNHLYPKEIWALKSFEVKLIIITFLCNIFHFRIAQSTLIHGIAFSPREIIMILVIFKAQSSGPRVPCNLCPL